MATNKNALIRYKVLDKCFRNTGKKYYINDLIEECNKMLSDIDPESGGISLRQIRDDIAFMKSSEGWSIELGNFKDGKKMYYRYEDTSYSIDNSPLNEVEIHQLQSAIDILSQFKGMPQFEWAGELIHKLKNGIDSNESSATIIEFDGNPYLKGIDHLGDLHNAILFKKVLKINYKPYEDEKPYDLEIHPYYLKQYNNRWFLFGYNPENKKHDWNLALDRIASIKDTQNTYHENHEIDWQEYFEDFIGVTKPEGKNTETVILHFIGKTGKYIETKPIHGSQKSTWLNRNILEVKLEILINYELERYILSYADSVVVKMPKSLVKTMKSRLKNAFDQY